MTDTHHTIFSTKCLTDCRDDGSLCFDQSWLVGWMNFIMKMISKKIWFRSGGPVVDLEIRLNGNTSKINWWRLRNRAMGKTEDDGDHDRQQDAEQDALL